ncbi:hypothetical protein VP1G_03797 [Cytospora mali]|uniref:Uncharacterized protein n=1 Tax=Cytospora mali TaxID=578113 RepID=A0A194UXX7_CYTMA|nr:hypothetical protein VP1G_03797 [Valsa mali var. pyri (nom. inval.)]
MSQFQVEQRQPSGEFNRFLCLPPELQLIVFETALLDMIKVRIVLLDIEMVPTFNPVRSRDVTLGWTLKVENHEQLCKDNPLELARDLLETCETGKYVADRFIENSHIYDRPRHCQGLLNCDLSLSYDVFWLPNDVVFFAWAKETYPAGGKDWKDEQRMVCLMVNLDTMEEMTRWGTGRFTAEEVQDEENGYVSLDDLSLTLENVLDYYPSCREIVVVAGTPSGCREHLSWSDLNYVDPDDKQMISKFDSYAVDRDEADRCQGVFQAYSNMRDDTMALGDMTLPVPEISFAFVKDRKSCTPPSPPQIAVPAGSGSKRSRDEDDEVLCISEMPANKRQRI